MTGTRVRLLYLAVILVCLSVAETSAHHSVATLAAGCVALGATISLLLLDRARR